VFGHECAVLMLELARNADKGPRAMFPNPQNSRVILLNHVCLRVASLMTCRSLYQ
jgi:hypothetical protein